MADGTVKSSPQDFFPAPYPAPLFAAAVRELDFGSVRKPGRKRLAFKVSNIGGAENLHVSLIPNLPNQQWFRVRPSEVTIPAGEDCIVDVDVDASYDACTVGKHELDVQIEAPGSMVQEIPRIKIKVEVEPEITLVAEPAVVDFGEIPLGESRTIPVTVTRTDDREVYLNERLVELVDDSGTHRPAWAEVKVRAAGRPGDPAAHSRAQVVDITFHTANRGMREYRCELRLAHIAPEVNPIQVPVQVKVTPPPELQVQWAVEPLPVFAGDSQESQLAIGNVGGGILRGRVTGNQFWLRVQNGEFAVKSGDAQWAAVRIGDPRLQEGTYEGLIEICSNDAGRTRTRRIPIELSVEGQDSAQLDVIWDGDIGRLPRGEKVTRSLTVRNRMSRPFQGKLLSGNPEWLQPAAGSDTVQLGPGEMKQLAVEVNTRLLPVPKMFDNHASSLQIVDGGGKEQWRGPAKLVVFPPLEKRPKWLLPALAAAGLLLLLVIISMMAMRRGSQEPRPTARTAPASSPATTAAPSAGTGGASQPGSGLAPGAGAGAPAGTQPPSSGGGQGVVTPDPAKARILYAQGMKHFAGKRWTKAAASFAQAARFDPDPAGCYVMLGRSRLQASQLNPAAAALKSAVKAKPASGTAHFWLGRVYAKQGSREAAKREFRAALKANPNDGQAKDALRKLR